MFTIAVCDDDMQERMQEVQIVKNIFSQKELEAGLSLIHISEPTRH